MMFLVVLEGHTLRKLVFLNVATRLVQINLWTAEQSELTLHAHMPITFRTWSALPNDILLDGRIVFRNVFPPTLSLFYPPNKSEKWGFGTRCLLARRLISVISKKAFFRPALVENLPNGGCVLWPCQTMGKREAENSFQGGGEIQCIKSSRNTKHSLLSTSSGDFLCILMSFDRLFKNKPSFKGRMLTSKQQSRLRLAL